MYLFNYQTIILLTSPAEICGWLCHDNVGKKVLPQFPECGQGNGSMFRL